MRLRCVGGLVLGLGWLDTCERRSIGDPIKAFALAKI